MFYRSDNGEEREFSKIDFRTFAASATGCR